MMRGAIDCVVPAKMRQTESTEVFTINIASNGDLPGEVRRDVESQSSRLSCWSRRLLWSLALDLPIFLLIVILLGLFELGMIPSNKAGFYCNDPALSHPFTGDTVTTPILMTGLLVAPAIIFLLTELMFIQEYEGSRVAQVARNASWLYRSYTYGLAANLLVVEVMKGIMGSPRPTFFDLCQPDTAKTCNGTEFVKTYTCTAEQYSWWLQMDSYRSFPSGHSSMSVYCGLFVAWYLQRRAFNWSNRSVLLVPLLQLLCLTFGVVSSLTRITDHRHHWWDVLAGTGIGVAAVAFSVQFLSENFDTSSLKTEKSDGSIKTTRTLLYDDQSRP